MKSIPEMIGKQIVIPSTYRSWGQAYKDNLYLSKKGAGYFANYIKTPKFDSVYTKYAVLLSKHQDFASKKYYNDILMSKVRTNIPNFTNFSTNYYTYLVPRWNIIYDQWDYEGASVVVLEEELDKRDRLLQIFESCPEGSYGYYAYRGLRPVKLMVQSFAAAEIDQFFASCSELLAQPFSVDVDNVMSALETIYWNTMTRKEYVDWAAGQLIGQGGRSKVVSLAARISGWVEGRRYTKLSGGKELTQEQWEEIKEKLISLTAQISEDTIADFQKWLGEKYDEYQLKNKE